MKCPRCHAVTIDDEKMCPRCGYLLMKDELCPTCGQHGTLCHTNKKGLFTNGEPAVSRFEVKGRTYLFYVRKCKAHGTYRAERK